MYNTQFKVKYYDIEKELIQRFNEKEKEENEYTMDDILDICSKLYRDEFLTVFGMEDFLVDKINEHMTYIYEKMIVNEGFKNIFEEMMNIYIQQFFKNNEKKNENEESIKQLILLFLFSQQLFHIMHKCVCQQFELGIIDNELLVELRNNSVEIIKQIIMDI